MVGLAAEARIARPLGYPVAIGGGSAEGATRAAIRLVDAGAGALISFGLAGGLDPALRPGALVVPRQVWIERRMVDTDPALSDWLGGAEGSVMACERVAATVRDKAALWRETGAAAIDLETASVIRVAQARGLRFAALRAICDPAERALPRAALIALARDGSINVLRVLTSLGRHPSQLGGLLALAFNAAAARRALIRRVAGIGPRSAERGSEGSKG